MDPVNLSHIWWCYKYCGLKVTHLKRDIRKHKRFGVKLLSWFIWIITCNNPVWILWSQTNLLNKSCIWQSSCLTSCQCDLTNALTTTATNPSECFWLLLHLPGPSKNTPCLWIPNNILNFNFWSYNRNFLCQKSYIAIHCRKFISGITLTMPWVADNTWEHFPVPT